MPVRRPWSREWDSVRSRLTRVPFYLIQLRDDRCGEVRLEREIHRLNDSEGPDRWKVVPVNPRNAREGDLG